MDTVPAEVGVGAALDGREAQPAGSDVTATASPSGADQRACAFTSAWRTPPPPHQGQLSSLGVPPRFEMTLPLPRQAIHSRGSWDPGP
jgi:hypothetical protein